MASLSVFALKLSVSVLLAGCVQFNVSREIGFNTFKSVKVYLNEILVFWPHLSLSAVSSSLWIGPLSEVAEPPITRRCGSLTKPSTRLRFHPTPDLLCKSLAVVFGSPAVAARG